MGNQFRLLLPAAVAARALQLEPCGWAVAWFGPTVRAAGKGTSGFAGTSWRKGLGQDTGANFLPGSNGEFRPTASIS